MVEMKKESIIVLALLALMISGCSPYSGKTPADTVVSPLGDKISVTEGCLVYALPMTVFELDIIAEKRTEVPGPYARYASELTGLDNVITGHTEKWSLAGIRLSAVEELDPSQFYIIQGTAMMQTNMLALRKSGLVLDINPDLYGSATHSDLQGDPDYAGMLFPDRGAYEYVVTKTDTAYRLVKVDTAFIRVPYLVQKKKGMSLVEEAREAAGRLLELREGRHMILTGETNVFPQDGAALEEINRLEREYMALFAGKSFTETRHFRIWITPDQQMAGKKTTIFTFSETSGVNTSPDGPGEPVLMEIGPSGKTRDLNMVMRPASMQKHANPADRVYYRVPDVAEINISLAGENLCTARRLIYQYGSLVALPANFIIGK